MTRPSTGIRWLPVSYGVDTGNDDCTAGNRLWENGRVVGEAEMAVREIRP